MSENKGSAHSKRVNRRFHYWAALVVSLPLIVVIGSGLLLQVKKEFTWIQPPTFKGNNKAPTVSFERILSAAQSVESAEIKNWQDISKLDVRPSKGVIKIRSKNGWEIQVDGSSGKVLHRAYRRSDLIESIHDGTFFHDKARLWLFLPAALVLLLMWISGLYMLVPSLKHKWARRKNKARQSSLKTKVNSNRF
jgi:uncharacterized iron-regulated membrane protein